MTAGKLKTAPLIILVMSLGIVDAQAQFNAQGRSSRSTKSPSSTKSSSSGKPPTRKSTQGRVKGAQAAAPDTVTDRNEETDRTEVLINRYRKLIIEQPGEEVPLLRLEELIRQRDGTLNQLFVELETLAESKSEAESYGAKLALSFYFSEQGKLDEARNQVQGAIALRPNLPAAHLQSGRIAVKQGNTALARQSFERALAGSQGADRTFLLRELRTLSLDSNDLQAASRYHAELTHSSRGNFYLAGELGRELLSRGKTQQAILELRRVAAEQKHDPRALGPALLDLGQAELAGGEVDRAIAHLENSAQLLKQNPGKQLEAQNLLAEAHRQNGDLPKFLEQLSKAAKHAQSFELLGRLYEQEGQSDKAIAAYREATKRAPQDIDLKLRLAKVLELTGDVDGAVTATQDVSRTAPGDVQLSLRLMNMLLAQGNRDAVLREWDRIFVRSKSDPEAILLLADFAERLAETERQKRALGLLSTQEQRNYRVLIDLGSRHFRRGDEAAAREAWSKIEKIVPDKARAKVILGEVLINHEAFGEGIALLKEAHQLAPRSPEVSKALAMGLERSAAQAKGAQSSGFANEAIEQYELLLTLPASQTDQALARRHLVRLYKRRGDLPLRIEQLKVAIKKHPKDKGRLRLLAAAHEKSGNAPAAIAVLEDLVRIYPGDIEALKELAPMQAQIGRFEQAIATWKKLLEADPKRSREYLSAMSEAARRHGDLKLSLSFAEKSLAKQGHDPVALALLGDLYLQQGRFEKAEETFLQALALDDGMDSVRLKLAELLAQRGKTEAAFLHLSQLVRQAKDETTIKRASSQLLSLGVGLQRLSEVETLLRQISISRPENQLYRELFFEVLTTAVYPLELRVRHGNEEEAAEARKALSKLAQRSSVVLLAALSSDAESEHGLALRLLGYDDTPSTQLALIAFAEGNHPRVQRILALAAVHAPERSAAVTRLAELSELNATGDPQFAAAATYALRSSVDAIPFLMRLLESDATQQAGHAALALSFRPKLKAKEESTLRATLLDWLTAPTAAQSIRLTALLGLSALVESHRGSAPSTQLLGISLEQDEVEFKQVLSRFITGQDELMAQLGLVLLGKLPWSEETKRALSTTLLSAQTPRRRIARSIAFSAKGTAQIDFGALYQAASPNPRQFGLNEFIQLLVQRFEQRLPEPEVSEPRLLELKSYLLSAANDILLTSGVDTSEVLRQLDSGGLLASFRSDLSETLLSVSSTPSPYAAAALRHLRASFGPQTASRLLLALGDRATAPDAYYAITEECSSKAAELLETFERESSSLDWLDRRRLLDAWNTLSRCKDPEVRKRAEKAGLRLGSTK